MKKMKNRATEETCKNPCDVAANITDIGIFKKKNNIGNIEIPDNFILVHSFFYNHMAN